MRMKLTHITAALAAAQLSAPSAAVTSQVVPAAFHGGGGFHGGYRGFHGDRGWGWHPWGWNPWGWARHW